jgi:uncharacterized coiled-coil DUF342 family protein
MSYDMSKYDTSWVDFLDKNDPIRQNVQALVEEVRRLTEQLEVVHNKLAEENDNIERLRKVSRYL